VFQRLQATGGFANAVGPPGSKVQIAGKLAEIVGEFGPEAEKVIGPTARKTAYRYRGTEKAPEKPLIRGYGEEIADAKRFGVEEEEADQRLLGFGSRRQAARGDIITSERRAVGARERRPEQVTPAVGQIAAARAGQEARPPNWAERGAGAARVADYLRLKLPDKHLYRLHLGAGNTPPSEGVIINSKGQLAVQAVGYGDDHYLPFNLKNLKSLKGGEYIRNRSVGGLTSEDVYTGLMMGARRVTVVSRSGTFTMEFDETFRGGRRYNDKALRMTRRYEQILDAVQSGQIDRHTIPPHWRKAIRREVEEEYGPQTPRSVIRDETDVREKEFKEKPDIEGRDLERAEAMISDMETRAAMGEIPEREAAAFRTQIMNELHNMKEVRFRLNGIGYEAGLKSLQEQFPYYIKSVKTRPTRDEELLEFELDEGYVEPGRNRPTGARAGLFGTKENPSEKISASKVGYQRGRARTGALQPAAAAAAATPAGAGFTTGTEGEPSTPDARRREQQAREDAYAMQAKARGAKKAAVELRKVAKEGEPDFKGEDPPLWWSMDDKQFKDYMDDPENAGNFHTFMARHKTSWSGAGGVPGFGDAFNSYEVARGATQQVKYQRTNAEHFPAVAYSFAELEPDNPAYHAGAREALITHEQTKLDREELSVNFTSKKPMSALSDSELEDEIDMTVDLRRQAKGKRTGVEDILTIHARNYPDAPDVERMKKVLVSDKALDKHLENIHRMRYLNEMKKLAKNKRPDIPARNVPSGERSTGGGGGTTGGLPATPSEPRPPTEPGHQPTTTGTTVNAREERLKGVRNAVNTLNTKVREAKTQSERQRLIQHRTRIGQFGKFLESNKGLTDPMAIDKEMDAQLNQEQRNYVAGVLEQS
jgi:hypothetical protein